MVQRRVELVEVLIDVRPQHARGLVLRPSNEAQHVERIERLALILEAHVHDEVTAQETSLEASPDEPRFADLRLAQHQQQLAELRGGRAKLGALAEAASFVASADE